MKDGFLRVCAATPHIRIGNPGYNAQNILALIEKAKENHAKVVVFPELCLTGYTCHDLFFQNKLLEEAESKLGFILEKTKAWDIVIALGLPVIAGGNLYNCGAVLHKGRLLGIVPKAYLPNYAEFYEMRHFSPAHRAMETETHLCGQTAPFGPGMIFQCENIKALCIGVEICEDLWVPVPPSSGMALSGATVILNLSASNDAVGKAKYRNMLVESQSGRCICAYVYAGAGWGESSQDLSYLGHRIIYENGVLLKAESGTDDDSGALTFADVDIQQLYLDRLKLNSFAQAKAESREDFMEGLGFTLKAEDLELIRSIDPYPFVPSGEEELEKRCEEIIAIQAWGLAERLHATGIGKVVVALSGGLDSTLALLVCQRAFKLCGLPAGNITAISMPGFGTTPGTKGNAASLADALGIKLIEVPISDAVKQHLKDIGHDINVHDITYENAQARERTQVAMDIANKTDAIMVGTGDMSELALGWTTYGGDHMSMYGVNSGVPKTLVKYLVGYFAKTIENEKARKTLCSILDTPISPELTPPSKGKIAQLTEQIIGPYDLHDFFLYHTVRHGFAPAKIKRMAVLAFAGKFGAAEVDKWLKVFIERFFRNQFKRSCLPDGPKVGSVALSPRGDW
ncbi:MAG: NAD(+) synthase, partial [Bacillota bacterium]|nr:NAD(+) synthase [Bacillota bacterium]